MPSPLRNPQRLAFWTLPVVAIAVAWALLIASGRDAEAQRPRLQQFLQRPLIQQALNPQLQIEAVAGQPFGVGRITVPLAGAATTDSDVQTLVAVSDRRGRVLYPAYEFAPMKQVVREFISMPQRVTTIYFLFQGPEALEFTQPVASVVQPKVDAAAYDRLLRAWWREYSAKGNALISNDSGPPDVKTYLTGMLGRRLNLPGTDPVKLQQQRNEITQALSLLIGSESIRDSIMQETLAGLTDGGEPANLPLPPKPASPVVSVPQPPAAAVTIEPIAMRVPEECLYVRFGNFPNFLWLRQRTDSVGGDLGNFLFERAVDVGAQARMETQLCAHQGALAPVLGPQVIADVAFIGTDTFQREGASLGILFLAKNNAALRFDLSQQRAEALKHELGAKEEKIELDGVTASFLSTPDNRVRSFYVQDGDYHLVTTSRYIAERFVATGKGQRSLGQSAEFRHARQISPAENDQTAFIYLSEAFQRNLLSPQYQIEMVRRLRSVADMQLLQLARLAAGAEGVPGNSLEQLIAASLLPAGFSQRADGSRLVETKDGLADSLRGRRGTFLPVPDVKIENITPSEARSLDRFRAAYDGDWQQMDPIIVSVRQQAGPTEGLERVTVNAQASPFAEKHFQTLSKWLGAPSQQRLAVVPGDLISAQASVRGGPQSGPGEHFMFGALKDAEPGFRADGIGAMLFKDWNARGYIGSWPDPGLLSMLGANGSVRSDANGFARLLLGQWERIYGQFTLMSFHPEVLEEVAPQLHFEPTERPAQVWLRTEDLTALTLATKVNSFGYRRALRSSQGIARFINSFTEQLHVSPKQDLALAESLLDAKLVDPLGGKFEYLPTHSGRALWMSTVTNDPRFQGTGSMPAGYQFPALKWFRGMNAELLMQPAQFVAHAQIDLPALTRTAGVELPSLPSLPSFTIPGFGKTDSAGKTGSSDKASGKAAENLLPPPPGPAVPKQATPQGPAPGPPAPGEK